jgi:biopolymer transport protein ExbD
MARNSNRKPPEISSGSMADIAFLLLIFFLVTTTIANDKGIMLMLPPKTPPEDQVDVDIPSRNIFKILANSKDQLLVEDEPWRGSMDELKEEVKKFILNFGAMGRLTEEGAGIYNSFPDELKQYVRKYGGNPNYSDEPTNMKHVVSFKANRGTSYKLYIDVLDAINAAYNEVYGARVGLTAEEFLALDKSKPEYKSIYDRAREGIPRAISIAEPDK